MLHTYLTIKKNIKNINVCHKILISNFVCLFVFCSYCGHMKLTKNNKHFSFSPVSIFPNNKVISHVVDNRRLTHISVFSVNQNVPILPPGITWGATFHLVQILRPPKNYWQMVMVITAMARVVRCLLRHRPQFRRPLRIWRWMVFRK